MEVSLRGRKSRVAEPALHIDDICALGEPVGGETVPEGVWGDFEPHTVAPRAQERLYPCAVDREKEAGLPFFIGPNVLYKRLGAKDNPLLGSFPQHRELVRNFTYF